MGTAFMRAYHAAHDQPKIFDDFLAHRLIKEAEQRIIEERQLGLFRLPTRNGPPPARIRRAPWRAGCSRRAAPHRPGPGAHAEDLLEQAVSRQGVRQYVILGAGLDTFAFRRPDLLAQLQVFEVDHPATQDFKRHRLLALSPGGAGPPAFPAGGSRSGESGRRPRGAQRMTRRPEASLAGWGSPTI